MSKGFLTGKKVFLRGVLKADMTSMASWINNPEVTHYMFMGDRPASVEQLERDWERNLGNSSEVALSIIAADSGQMVGSCGLYCINAISRHAELRIIIGERDHWGQGFCAETCRLLLDYAFEKLNLNKVWLGVNADNAGALKCYESAGFVREGVLRQEIYRNGRYYDAIRLSIIRDERAPHA